MPVLLQVGWPTSVGGKQKPGFLKRLHALKQEELNSMVDDAQLPLRTGACIQLAAYGQSHGPCSQPYAWRSHVCVLWLTEAIKAS